MLELYADAPFALVGVNSDADLKEAKQNKAENFGADSGYRSWWDGHAAVNTAGPIAQRWGVTGWPTICKRSDLPCAVGALLTPNAGPCSPQTHCQMYLITWERCDSRGCGTRTP